MKKTDKSKTEWTSDTSVGKPTASMKNDVNLDLDFDIIRKSLLLQKSEILNRDNDFKKSQESIAKYADEADQTVQELHNNVSIQLHERERMSLLLIERTLSKFTDGTYGSCESCGDFIGAHRLQARPLAALCISCMEEIENANSQTKQHSAFFQ